MTTTDWIQIAAIIVSLITSLIAIIISSKSLKLTRYSIEEANRPYVVIYETDVQVSKSIHTYLVIKNFGNTGATIESINYYPEYRDVIFNRQPFLKVKNHFIAPGQQFSTSIRIKNNSNKEVRTFHIKYRDSANKIYREKIILNEFSTSELVHAKTIPDKNTSLETVISKATEELIRRNL
ncbi:hypothetical protein [Cytobacillus sp. FSL R7-0680]|uniref:hypothetical protein n=1 Tax=Cytobacillus sp. FSL R7-0680 TaxID=2921689 RepID=UPI0030F8A7C8